MSSAVVVDAQLLAVLDADDAETVARALAAWAVHAPLSPGLDEARRRLAAGADVLRQRRLTTGSPTRAEIGPEIEVEMAGNPATMGAMGAGVLLGLSARRIRQLACSGRLAGRLVDGSGWQFDPADVAEFARRRAA